MTCRHGCCESNKEHWSSISIAPSATPSRSPQAVEVNNREAQWDKDMPAYKRLRKNGLQPKAIDGCADLESKAATKFEVESGQVFSPEKQKRHDEVLKRADEYKEAAGL